MDEEEIGAFLALSSALTGFAEIDLEGTGLAPVHLSTLKAQAGGAETTALLDAYAALPEDCSAEERHAALADAIMSDQSLGPLARNLIKLWYLGVWEQLAGAGDSGDPSFIVSEEAYELALVWTAMGAHAKGARQPGFASWRFAPKVPAP